MQTHDQNTVSWMSCNTHARVYVDVAVATRPRQGFRFWWVISNKYNIMSMQSYAGKSSKWAFTMRRAWITYLGSGCLDALHVAVSAQAFSRNTAPHTYICLLWLGASALPFDNLRCRWASCTPSGGGLTGCEGRAAARAVLYYVVHSCRALKAWLIPLYCESAWKPRMANRACMCA